MAPDWVPDDDLDAQLDRIVAQLEMLDLVEVTPRGVPVGMYAPGWLPNDIRLTLHDIDRLLETCPLDQR